ncbi:SRPBCC family protein [Pyxidicoccus fallax]|uniref:SRPBCC family protein n=1 Tax=Pyxidicoccus fallax TaxID=394095 RepID=A0A848LMV6_9BACT|nr:SRPBCC family protein [Pyxidicoccus fallax]NMO19041.1 SRPBCC family protein [Pyxidicoccus fallax]NPC84932.1 SRPBCC family protein [Pyxidicoccus fallax]
MSDYGVVAGAGTVRFQRVLPGPIERVWEYLTVPEKRGKWLASGPMELRVGGRVELQFLHASLSPRHPEPTPERYKQFENGCSLAGIVTACEPPRLLSYTWGGDSEVTFELSPRGRDVMFVLTHRRLDRKHLANVASGWHTHLGILEDTLHEVEVRPFWSTHTRMEAEYTQRFGVE